MSGYLVDASVICRYILTNDVKEYSSLRRFLATNRHQLYSIKLINYEILNVLRYSLENREDILRGYELYREMDIDELLEGTQIHRFATEIALTVGDSVYDASYHAASLIHDKIFITLDRKYFDKAKKLGNIALFSELKL